MCPAPVTTASPLLRLVACRDWPAQAQAQAQAQLQVQMQMQLPPICSTSAISSSAAAVTTATAATTPYSRTETAGPELIGVSQRLVHSEGAVLEQNPATSAVVRPDVPVRYVDRLNTASASRSLERSTKGRSATSWETGPADSTATLVKLNNPCVAGASVFCVQQQQWRQQQWQQQQQQVQTSVKHVPACSQFSPATSTNELVSPANAIVGSRVRIRGRAEIHRSLFPYADSDAVVEDVPVYPNTWYTVRFRDHSLIKIRRSSFLLTPMQHPMPHLQLDSNPALPDNLVVGASVVITSDINAPDQNANLAGKRGVIAETPTHPDTTFAVKLEDSTVVRLPQTSLGPVPDPPKASSTIPTPSAIDQPSEDASADFLQKWLSATVLISSGKHTGLLGKVLRWNNGKFLVKVGEKQLLKRPAQLQLYGQTGVVSSTASSPDFKPTDSPDMKKSKRPKSTKNLVGTYVRIEAGKHAGSVGYVSRGGNGYYSVELTCENMGDDALVVMKRSSDLRLVSWGGAAAVDGADPAQFGRADWVGQCVVIISGKNRNDTGVIKSSGHGFYCVELDSGRGQVMKRAQELELRSSGESDDQKIWKVHSHHCPSIMDTEFVLPTGRLHLT